MRRFWQLIALMLVWLLLPTTQGQVTSQEKEAASAEPDKESEAVLKVLRLKLDFESKSRSAFDIARLLAEYARATDDSVPADFAIRFDTDALQRDGITRNQRIKELVLKGRPLSEALTSVARQMNPFRPPVADPSSKQQRVVWTVADDPQRPGAAKAVLITTRAAAKKNGYLLPAAFLRGDELDQQLQLVAAVAAPMAGDMNVAWSKIATQGFLEGEVKRLLLAVENVELTRAEFNGGGYRHCRVIYSELALLFAVIGEYDGDLPWKKQAPYLRDMFSRTAKVCKVGSPLSLKEAKQTRRELRDLVLRGRVMAVGKVDRKTDWSKVGDRPPLMKRMEIAWSTTLKRGTGDAENFRLSQDEIQREAAIVLLIATAIRQKGRDDADDEDYVVHATRLGTAARKVRRLAEAGDFEKTKEAVGVVNQSCARCHDEFR